jgi:hypothetical protein
MFKSYYTKKKEDIKNKTENYLSSIDAIFADTKIVDHIELDEDIMSTSTIIKEPFKKWWKWWKCC